MKIKTLIAATILTLALSGCATTGRHGYQPILMGNNYAAQQQALYECRQYADRVSPGRSAGFGAIAGALLGAAVGSIVDSDTAKNFAGMGAALGGMRGAGEAVQSQEDIVRKCLSAKGFTVLN